MSTPTPSAISTTCPTRRASRTSTSPSPTRSASAARTPPWSFQSIRSKPGDVAELERRLGHRFLDPDLLTRALTHASYANEHPPLPDNEPLALVGDAALGLVVAEHVVAVDPAAPVGILTPRRAELVSGANLARWAADLDLGPLIRLGRGEDQTGGRTRESILATTLEALLGAIYLEGGIAAVRGVITTLAAW